MRPIPNFPDYYVTTHGDVFSMKFDKAKLLSTHVNNRGYGVVSLYNNGKRSVVRIHRLVCETYHSNPDNLPTVDHINRDKLDNRKCNLRWADYVTQTHNSKDRIRNEYRFTYKGETVIITNMTTYCKENNLCASRMYRVARGQLLSHRGYTVCNTMIPN